MCPITSRAALRFLSFKSHLDFCYYFSVTLRMMSLSGRERESGDFVYYALFTEPELPVISGSLEYIGFSFWGWRFHLREEPQLL